jgi:hypothetical protein
MPDNGLSLSKKYFTFKNGGLYQHYVPLRYETITTDFGAVIGPLWLTEKDGHIWTAQEAGNYNRFYGNTLEADGAFSSITTVLNQQPSVVKMFNTINYEGSQTYVVKPQNASEVNINNAAAWKNNFDIKGWRCSEIKTDLDSGTVKEFIEKEGKWFNYIKGLNINPTIANTSLFSTQGIGIIPSGSVSDITEFDESGEEIILGGVVNQGVGQGVGAGDFEYGGGGGGGGGGGY